MSIFHRIFAGKDIQAELPSAQFQEAFAIWSEISQETGKLPRLSDMNSMLEKSLLEWAGIAVRLPDNDFEFVHFGAKVQEKATVPFLGRSINELSPKLRLIYRSVLDQACNTAAPVYTIHAAQVSRDVTMWGRLILPISGAANAQYVLILFQPYDLKQSLIDLAFDTISEGMLALDPVYGEDGALLDAHILMENRAASEVFGMPAGTLAKSGLRKLMDSTLGFEAFLTLADAVDARRNVEFITMNAYGVPYALRLGMGKVGMVLTLRPSDIIPRSAVTPLSVVNG